MLAHPAMNRGCGLAMQLLVENRFQQRLEGRRSRIELQGKRAGTIYQRAQFGVFGAQMRQCLVSVEGKFLTASIVDHRRL